MPNLMADSITKLPPQPLYLDLGRARIPYDIAGTFAASMPFRSVVASALECYLGPHALIGMESQSGADGQNHDKYYVQRASLSENYMATYHVFNESKVYMASVRVTPTDAYNPKTAQALIYLDSSQQERD